MATMVAGTALTGVSTTNTGGTYAVRFTHSWDTLTPAAPKTELDLLDDRVNRMRVKL